MNRLFRKPIICAATAIAMMLLFFSCSTNNWTQFRGPHSNLIARGENLPTDWGEDKNVLWTYEIGGDSWTSPVIWGNKIFVTWAIPEKVAPPPERQEGQPPADQEENTSYLSDVYRWEVACVDLETGKELWKNVAFKGSPRTNKHRAHNYAAETPVTDGKRLYVYFGMTGVFCYNLEGELLWKKDLGAYETLNDWGSGSSPVVYKDLLFVQVDCEEQSFLVALDTKTGEEKWKADREEGTNYSTPIIWKNSIRTELVVGGKKARSYDPVTGEMIWELNMAGHYNIPSAVADENFLYIGNAGYRDVPSTLFCVRAGVEGDITPGEGEDKSSGVVWANLDAPLGNPSPLLYNGLLYLVSSRGGEFTCMDPATGDIIYKEKIEKVAGCWASPWAQGDKIFFYDEKGVTQVIKAGKEYELLYQNQLDDKFWASVAVKEDAYVFKGVKKMYCVKNPD